MGNQSSALSLSSSSSSASSLSTCFVNYEAIQEQWASSPHPRMHSFAYPWIKSKTMILIHVMSDPHLEQCLIHSTIPSTKEEQVINGLISHGNGHGQGDVSNICVIIYGKNSLSIPKCMKQRSKLQQLGFSHVYVYGGGMFEWLLLNDMYQSDLFPLDRAKGFQVDLLDYRGEE